MAAKFIKQYFNGEKKRFVLFAKGFDSQEQLISTLIEMGITNVAERFEIIGAVKEVGGLQVAQASGGLQAAIPPHNQVFTFNYERFISLLKKSGVSNPNDKVLKVAKRYLASRMLVASTPLEAKDIYGDAKLIPETITTENFKKDNGIDLNGPLLTNAGRSTLIIAFLSGVPKILKLPEDPKSAEHEATVTKDLLSMAETKHLVPVTSFLLKRSDDTIQLGLLMPFYVCTLENMPEPISLQVAQKCAQALIEATNYMHEQIKSAHCDIKPSNVFINENGHFFLGDFGSTTTFGENVREKSDLFFPSDLLPVSAAIADKYLIVATILDKLQLKRDEPPKIQDIVDSIPAIENRTLIVMLQEMF